MQPATASAVQPAISLLERTPALLETLLRDLPADVSQWKPAPDRWSISEVLAHLADLEDVYADRTRRMVTEDTPALQRYDQAAAAERGDYSNGMAAEHLVRFAKTRRVTVTLLKSLPPGSGERSATHSELGTITLAEMLNEWASHDLGHLRQIAELYRAHEFHPNCGPFRKYSNPKP